MTDLVIRPVNADDRAAWTPLWDGYMAFSERRLPDDVTDLTWIRLTEDGVFSGLLAIANDGAALGFIHYLNHPSTWTRSGDCYIEDLFVDEAARGKGVARGLIDAVVATARRDGARRVCWHAADSNATAQRLYDRIAKRAPLIRYQIDLSSPQQDAP